jgi:hypothetical protein
MRNQGASGVACLGAPKEGLQVQLEKRSADLVDGRRVTVFEPEISW